MDAYIARVKKPHKKFAAGDIVIGERQDGQMQRLVCWGWSSKLNVFIQAYSMRYQGWVTWDGQTIELSGDKTTGSGHLTIIGEFETSWGKLRREFSEVKTRADFMRQLGLFGGNVLEWVEAAATHPRSYRETILTEPGLVAFYPLGSEAPTNVAGGDKSE